MSWLTSDVIQSLTPAGMLLLVVLFFMAGLIRPRSAVTEVRQDRDARIADAREQIDQWREAHRLSEVARELNAASLREALEVAKAAEDALLGFRKATDWAKQDHKGDV